MNKAFEKILERLEEKENESILKAPNTGDFNNPDYQKWMMKSFGFKESMKIVQEVAEQYKNENYFNLDHVTLHKCPKCGGDAQHRVNKKGSWACGCFECKVFKANYDHQKAIQEWEDFCKEYNGGWIPCGERLPEQYTVLCCDRYGETLVGHPYFDEVSDTNYSAESDNEMMYNCIAWQPLPEPYKE